METANSLPIEIVSVIVGYFIDGSPKAGTKPTNSADSTGLGVFLLRQLLNLRLVGKSWAAAVVPYAYRNLHFDSACVMNSFVETWKHYAGISYMARLNRLSFDQIVYPALGTRLGSDSSSFSDSSCDIEFDIGINHESILCWDVEELIRLCGHTLTDLKLHFRTAVGFSPEIIDSIKQVRNLNVLIIVASPYGIENHSESLQDLLNVTTELRSLSLDIGRLKRLNLNPGSLPHLEHLSIGCETNNWNAITKFCKAEGRQIKHLEYLAYPGCENADKILLALQNSLEVLFVDATPDILPPRVNNVNFPKLRVIRNISSSRKETELTWLQLEIFANMRVYVTDYWYSEGYWRKMLKDLNGKMLAKPRGWEHIVFVTSDGARVKDDLELAALFHRQGIHCHLRHYWNYAALQHLAGSVSDGTGPIR